MFVGSSMRYAMVGICISLSFLKNVQRRSYLTFSNVYTNDFVRESYERDFQPNIFLQKLLSAKLKTLVISKVVGTRK